MINSFPSVDDTSNIKVKFGDFNNKAFQWEIDSQEEAAFIKRLVTDNRVVPPKEQLKWEGASRLSFLFPDGKEWGFQTYFRGKQNKLLFSLYDFSAYMIFRQKSITSIRHGATTNFIACLKQRWSWVRSKRNANRRRTLTSCLHLLACRFQTNRSPAWSRCSIRGSIRVFIGEDGKKCSENDLEVQPDRPLFDIAVIEFHASLHFVNRVGLPAAAVDLC